MPENLRIPQTFCAMMDEVFWSDLLQAIEDGDVVPVVGQGLTQVDTPEGPVPLSHYLAQQLALELRVNQEHLPTKFDTNDVICASKDFQGDPNTLSRCMVRILDRLQIAPPEVLFKLASIDAFPLFINVSYDPLLEAALLQARGIHPNVISLRDRHNDIPTGGLPNSVVYHIFGKAISAFTPFAMTDGQLLEHMHFLLTSPSAPKGLLDRLRESHLLFLGVSFPDWLARLFIRLARQTPLWDSRRVMEIVTEPDGSDNRLIGFLQRFSPRQTYVPTAVRPEDFVAELYRRWKSKRITANRQVVSETPHKPKRMEAGAVFLSYAREDREAVICLAKLLTDNGIEVWMDDRLVPGDDYGDMILRHVRTSGAFIPILSKHTANDTERWYRREWSEALNRLSALRCTGRRFIFPIILPGISEIELAPYAEEILRHQASKFIDSRLPLELFDQIREAQRKYRSDLTKQPAI